MAERTGPRRRRIACAVVAGAAGASLLAGCGVPTDAGPTLISTTVRFPPSGSGGHEPRDQATEQRAVYVVKGTHLVEVSRQVPVDQGVDGFLAALENAPSPDEAAAAGLRSALPAGGGHLRCQVADGVALVAVPASYESLGLVQQVLAVGQIVYTVTAIEGIGAVELSVDGRRVDAPVDGGQLETGPVTRADYASIAPVRATGRAAGL